MLVDERRRAGRDHVRRDFGDPLLAVPERMGKARRTGENQFGIHLDTPAALLFPNGDIDAVRLDIIGTAGLQPDVAVDARAGIPAAVRTAMDDL
ncbi:hypothetical protein D3C75_1062510 [compost metagenome]